MWGEGREAEGNRRTDSPPEGRGRKGARAAGTVRAMTGAKSAELQAAQVVGVKFITGKAGVVEDLAIQGN